MGLGNGPELLGELSAGSAEAGGILRGGIGRKGGKGGICHGFVAIDPAIFGDAEAIKAHLSAYLEELRNSPKAEGQDRIYTHGEKEVEAEKKLMENGIPVNDNTMVEVYEMCQYLDMDFSKYFGDYVPEASAGFKSPETFK